MDYDLCDSDKHAWRQHNTHPSTPIANTTTTVSSFVPQHVLLGCISGMGVFIGACHYEDACGSASRLGSCASPISSLRCTRTAVEGIGISTGVDWSWEPDVLLQQLGPGPLCKIVVTAALTAGLSLLNMACPHPITTPAYFFLIPALFFFCLYLAHIPLASARAAGWLFSFDEDGSLLEPSKRAGGIGVGNECRSFPGVLACLDLSAIAWDIIPTQLFTILGLVFFSVIHVPVNVPALSVTAGVEADLNDELKVCVHPARENERRDG